MCYRMRVGMIMCFSTAATSTVAAALAAAPAPSSSAAFDNLSLQRQQQQQQQHPASSLLLAAQTQMELNQASPPKLEGGVSGGGGGSSRKSVKSKVRRRSRSQRSQNQEQDLDVDQQQEFENDRQQEPTRTSNINININNNNNLIDQRLRHQQQQPPPPPQQSAPTTTTTSLQPQQKTFTDRWHEYWSGQPFPSGYTQSSIFLLACLISSIIFLIVVGNLLVCIAIFTEKSLKPTQNWFIASLAVSDMMLGLVVMPFSLARELMGFWIFGPLFCDIHEAVDVLLTTASINTLCLISLDRYWSITQAVSYLKKRTPRRGALMIAFVWVFSAAVSLPPLVGWKKQHQPIIAQVPSTNTLSFSTNNNNNNQNSSTLNSPSTADEAKAAAASGDENNNRDQQQFQEFNQEPGESEKFSPSDELATPILVRRRQAGHFYKSPTPSQPHLKSPTAFLLQNDDIHQLQHQHHPHHHQILTSNQQLDDEPFPMDTPSSIINTPTGSLAATGGRLDGTQSSGDLTTEYPSCQLSDDIGYVLYSALGSFFIPCAVMVFTYIKIFLAARSRARRAISKQSRGQAVNKRLAARRAQTTTGLNQSTCTSARPLGASMGVAELNARDVSTGPLTSPSSQQHTHNNNNNNQTSNTQDAAGGGDLPAIMKGGGKIVIVERKKSLAAINQPTSTTTGASIAATAATTTTTTNIMRAAPSVGGVAGHAHPSNIVPSDDPLANRATYDCSQLAAEQAAAAAAAAAAAGGTGVPTLSLRGSCQNNNSTAGTILGPSEQVVTGSSVMKSCANLDDHPFLVQSSSSCATLTTSGAKQASASALTSSASNDSSMITVMNASMSEVPLTRFTSKVGGNFSSIGNKRSTGAITTADDQEKKKAAALLKAISEVRVDQVDPQLLKEVEFSLTSDTESNAMGPHNGRGGNPEEGVEEPGSVPDIVLERRATAAAIKALAATADDDIRRSDKNNNNNNNNMSEKNQEPTTQQIVRPTTNETCFMTIEEDSDMFEAQAGRTINMLATATATAADNKSAAGHMGVTIGSGQETNSPARAGGCNNIACRLRHQQMAAARSGSSYCDSSLTINDDDEDEDDDDVGDEDDEDDNEQVDDEEEAELDDCGLLDEEQLTDGADCNGYSVVSCTLDQYCGRGHGCRLCSECEHHHHQQQTSVVAGSSSAGATGSDQFGSPKRHLSICDSPLSKSHQQQQQQQQHHHHLHHLHHHHHHHHLHDHHSHHEHRCPSELQSLNGELEGDNVSHLTEYRSNDDLSSSFVGHDVLDATDPSPSHHHQSERKKSIFHQQDYHQQKQDQANNRTGGASSSFGERKKSLISGFRLTRLGSTAPLSNQGGGLIALAAASQQQQASAAAGGGGGTRNLKALRQNFFLKLNQLTAKSNSAKQQELKDSKKGNNQTMSTQSSGTDHEASMDGGTTSAIHSTEYPAETTGCDLDDAYEQQTLPDSQVNNKQMNQTLATGYDVSKGDNLALGDGKELDEEGKKSTLAGGMASNSTTGGLKNNGDDKTLLLVCSNNNISSEQKSDSSAMGESKRNFLSSSSLMQITTNGKYNLSKEKQQPQVVATGAGRAKKALTTAMSSSVGPSAGGGSTNTNRAYLASDNERHKRKLAKARERRATLILGLIMTCFICAWMPFFIFYVLRALCPVCIEYFSPRVQSFIFWMGYCNSAINPIIYTIFNRDFRKAFRKILFKCL